MNQAYKRDSSGKFSSGPTALGSKPKSKPKGKGKPKAKNKGTMAMGKPPKKITAFGKG